MALLNIYDLNMNVDLFTSKQETLELNVKRRTQVDLKLSILKYHPMESMLY